LRWTKLNLDSDGPCSTTCMDQAGPKTLRCRVGLTTRMGWVGLKA